MKKIIQKVLRLFGYRIVNINSLKTCKKGLENNSSKESMISTVFNIFKEVGFEPTHILDIGANHGTWTREVLKYYPDSNYTLVEPQEWLKESFSDLLESDKIQFLPIGAGKENGRFNFTLVDRDDSCSFGYTESQAKVSGFRQIEVEVKTINQIVQESLFPKPDMVKIDAEGLDLEVMQGSSDLFGVTEVFLIEATVNCKQYDNSMLKVITYMDSIGYSLFDITDLNRPFNKKTLWLTELVFVKKGGMLNVFNWV